MDNDLRELIDTIAAATGPLLNNSDLTELAEALLAAGYRKTVTR
jgi:hypothetical protein